MKITARIIALIISFPATGLFAQNNSVTQQMARTVMTVWKDSFALGKGPAKWSYDQGVILKSFEGIWQYRGDPTYFNYIQKSMDFYVDDAGNIKGYKHDEYN